MRVYLASHGAERSGAELSLIEITTALQSRGHHCIVSSPSEGPFNSEIQDVLGQTNLVRISSRRWMGKRLGGAAGAVRLLQALVDVVPHVRMIKSQDFDVMVLNTGVAPAPLVAAWLCGIPRVTLIRESMRTNPTLRSCLPRKFICAILYRLSTKLVFNSKFVRDEFGCPGTVVYPSVSQKFRNVPRSTSSEKAENVKTRVVMLGSISVEKGQVALVDACISLDATVRKNVTVEIYGHGSAKEESDLRARIEQAGVGAFVQFMGETRNAPSVYARADLSVVCAKHEAFGKVTAESVLAGVPVIGFDHGGTSEILANGGGILIPGNVASLVEALNRVLCDRKLLESLRESCGANSLVRQCLQSAGEIAGVIEAEAGGNPLP